MKQTLLFLFILGGMASCSEKFNEDVLTVTGIYEANVVGVDGPFIITISVDHGSDILIDAPFNGMYWYLAEARIKKEEEDLKEIKIPDQRLDDGIYLEGEGVYYNYSIQLDYTLTIDGFDYDYSIVGTKQ
jgi:hypothetical protein